MEYVALILLFVLVLLASRVWVLVASIRETLWYIDTTMKNLYESQEIPIRSLNDIYRGILSLTEVLTKSETTDIPQGGRSSSKHQKIQKTIAENEKLNKE